MKAHVMNESDPDNKLFREVRKYFFVPPEGVLVNLTRAIEPLPEPYQSIGQAFVHNLKAVIETSTIPFAFANENTHDLHWQRMLIAERIRALPLPDEQNTHEDPERTKQRDDVARSMAPAKFHDFTASEEGVTQMSRDTSKQLLSALKLPYLQQAFAELLQQSLVLAWSAFEVLSRDFFVCYVNHVPSAVAILLGDPGCRKRFDVAKLPVEVLAEHGYDLSSKMGTILAPQNDLADLATIKSAFLALFGTSPVLRSSLGDRRLWQIAQRRHMIVHRRAIVDVEFVRNTGESLVVGSKLPLSPMDIEDAIIVLRDAGIAILCSTPSLKEAKHDG
jgi:hypothetical protein